MSRDGGLVASFWPLFDPDTKQITIGFSVMDPIIKKRNNKHVFFGVCVEKVLKATAKQPSLKRPAAAQVSGIVTVPLASPGDGSWRYHDTVYATRPADDDQASWAFSLTTGLAATTLAVPVGYLLDADATLKFIRVQLDRALSNI